MTLRQRKRIWYQGRVLLPVVLSLAAVNATPTYHYVRSNIDGSMPEHIVFRPRGRREIDVFKYISPGTRSAYVSCLMTGDLKSPLNLRSWMLDKGGKSLMATLDYDASGGYASVFVKPSGGPAESVLIPSKSWHIFNMDLASLALTLANANRRTFRLNFVEPNPKSFSPAMVSLGEFALTPSGTTRRHGVDCIRWELSGMPLKRKRGSIWMSRRDGYLVEAIIPIPNHEGYSNFRIFLSQKVSMTQAQWQSFVSSTVRERSRPWQ